MSASPCLACGEGPLNPHWQILLRCASCGFITAPQETQVDVQQLYDGNYFKGEEYLDYASDEAFFKKNFRKRLDQVIRHGAKGRLLEIGAAYGFFLDLARQYFDVVGFEVNREAARHGCEKFGLDIRTDDFLQSCAEDIGGAVDVTVMWDVIEHLERPDRFIEHIAAISKPGAMLHITTGDAGSRLARFRGRKWRMVHPPTHLHYFDRRTLPQLLSRNGFRTVEICSVGVARSFRQVLYSVLVLGLGRRDLYPPLAKWIPAASGFTLNTFDIMHVVARRD